MPCCSPSYLNIGGVHALQWLEKYTFPAEAALRDTDRARLVSKKAVEAVLKRGTTTAAWYATIHLEASLALVDEV